MTIAAPARAIGTKLDDARRFSAHASAALWGLLAALFACALAHLLFRETYQSNDDPAMDMIARGIGDLDEPQPYLVFINILVGKLLCALYRAAPGFPWYRSFLIAVQLVAGFVVYSVLWSRGSRTARVFLITVFAVAFDVDFYVNPQFTVTAALAAIAAVLLAIGWTERGCPRAALALPAIVALLAVSALIRAEACGMIALLGAPAAGFEIVRLVRSAPRLLWRALAPWVLGGAVCTGLVAYHQYEYMRHPEWRDFYRYNVLKSKLIDTGEILYTPATKHVFDAIGWSESDYKMFMMWAFIDEERFSLARLERLAELYQGVPWARPAWGTRLTDVFARRDAGSLLKLLVVLLPLCCITNKHRAVVVGLSYASTALAIGYLVFGLNRCPPRVFEPMFAFAAAVAIFSVGQNGPLPRRGRVAGGLQVGAVCLALALMAAYFAEQSVRSDEERTLSQSFERSVAKLKTPPGRLYVNWGGALPVQFLPPLGNWSALRGFKTVSLGWGTRSSATRRRLSQYHIDDFYRALYTRDDIRVIAVVPQIRALQKYAQEHYGETVRIASVENVHVKLKSRHAYLFSVYRLVRKPSPFVRLSARP